MGKAFRLLFNLYPGEWKKAAFFIILGLLWSIGGYGTLILSEGLFLEHVGADSLPRAYLAIAGVMCLLSAILIFALSRLSVNRLLFTLITLSISVSLLFLSFLPTESPTFWFLFKVYGWVMPISTYILYWAFVDLYFDLQDGKRFFALFNSVTFLGDAIGGGIVSTLLAPCGTAGLLLLFTLFMVSSIPCCILITRRISPLPEEHTESTKTGAPLSFKGLFSTIFRSKFTLYLLAFYFVMQVLAIVTEFNYLEAFEKAFSNTSGHDLTEYIGACAMWVSLGNMLFGMFLYSRLVKRLGINNIVIIAPAFFLLTFFAWNFQEGLPIAIFAMIAREGMVYSFDDNNLNLLISGVPTRVKNQVRISVESFFEPIGMFMGGLLLISFQGRGHLLGMILSILALGVVFLLRSHYAKAIFRNLMASAIRFEKKTTDWIAQFSKKEKRRTEFHLLSKLKTASEKEQLLAFEYLIKIENAQTLPRLLNHLGRLSLPGKLRAIELFSESNWATEASVLERLERWRRVLPHPAIKSAIHFYFARHGMIRPERVMHDLESEHLGIRAAAILTFKTAAQAEHFPSCCALASDQLKQLLDSKIEKEVCSGLRIMGIEQDPTQMEPLLSYLKHPSQQVSRAAAAALLRIARPEHVSYARELVALLPSLSDLQVRLSCLGALEKISDLDSLERLILGSLHFRPAERKSVERVALAVGKEASEMLLRMVRQSSAPDRCRLLAGKILGKLDRKLLRKHLYAIVRTEIERAYFYYYHAHEIQRQVPQHNLSMLESALFTGYHSIIDFMIQILGVAGSIEESEVLSVTLRSPNRKIRAQALESLEKSCEAPLFALLEPLITDQHPEQKVRHYLKSGRIPYTLNQLLTAMQHSASLGDQIVSMSLKARLQTPDWREALQQKVQEGDPIFQHFAQELS